MIQGCVVQAQIMKTLHPGTVCAIWTGSGAPGAMPDVR